MRTRNRTYITHPRSTAKRHCKYSKQVKQEDYLRPASHPTSSTHSSPSQEIPDSSFLPSTTTSLPHMQQNTITTTFDFKPFTASTQVFNPHPISFPCLSSTIPYSFQSSAPIMTDSSLEMRALQEIDRANKKLMININFTHLAKDGSNFVEWKKNTSRAMKSLLSIKEYWDVPLPLTPYVHR